MKKYFLFLAAGTAITLASCGGESTPATETLNVDSLAQVKVDSIAAVEKAKSDSIIAAQAIATADSLKEVMKADSIAAAAAKAAGKKAPAKKAVKPVNTTVVKEVTPPPPPTIGNGKPKLTEPANNNTIGNGKPKL